nr:hypothetical protein CFP56_22505 [Quercus suber]
MFVMVALLDSSAVPIRQLTAPTDRTLVILSSCRAFESVNNIVLYFNEAAVPEPTVVGIRKCHAANVYNVRLESTLDMAARVATVISSIRCCGSDPGRLTCRNSTSIASMLNAEPDIYTALIRALYMSDLEASS